MKKITMICMAALFLMATSCKKEKFNENDGLGFNAKAEVHADGSKTYLHDRTLIWDNGTTGPADQIRVTNKNGTAEDFTFNKRVDESDGRIAEFTSDDITEGFFVPPYNGYYPKDFDPTSYQLSQHQNYRWVEGQASFDQDANPMIATDEDQKYLHFKNVLGILELQFYSAPTDNVKVKQIRVRSIENTKKLWGDGSVNGDGEFVVTSGGSHTVMLDCPTEGVELSKDEDNPTSFFILLPPGTLDTGLEVDVVDTDGEFWIKRSIEENTIIRSHIRRMPAESVKTCTSEDVQLWYNAPYWATKNLGAENPWNYGDYYQWGATKKYYNDRGWGNYATLYNEYNKPAQTGSGNIQFIMRSGLPSNSTAGGFNGGYNYNKNCPYCKGEGTYASSWSNYINDTELDDDDDIVIEETGGKYHLPSRGEFKQLFDNTTHPKVTNYHEMNGSKYFGIGDYDDRFIFIPASGCIGTYNNGNSGSSTWTEERGQNFYLLSSTRQERYANYILSDMSASYNDYDEATNRWIAMPARGVRSNN